MIDRKALWIFVAAFLATTGAAIWQLSLLPDWRHMPLGGRGSYSTVSGLVLLFGSLMLTALAAGICYGIKVRHERSLQ